MADSAVSSGISFSRDIERQETEKDGGRQAWFTIGDLAREFDVTLRTLRFYEDKGLLNPRREGLNRIYNRRDRARLRLVLMGKRIGFSLVEIKELLDLHELKDGGVTQLRVALKKFIEQIDVLETQKQDIEKALVELRELVDTTTRDLKKLEAARA